jgi:sortase A
MNWRTLMRGVGRASITVGVLILLFVVYQLWGTGLAEARAQHRLRHQFERSLAGGRPATPTTGSAAGGTASTATDATPTTSTVAVTPPPGPPAIPGEAVGIIRIPRIGVNAALVEGVGVGDLKQGPGHYPNSPLPGHSGNAAIAGHRTTYGAPFYHLDELRPGDDIELTTREGTFAYTVASSREVAPTELSVLDASPDNRLTLTTCTPRFSAVRRLIVVSRLVGTAIPATGRPVTPPPTTVPATTPASAPPAGATVPITTSAPTSTLPDPSGVAAGESASLSGTGGSTVPAIAWALVCAAVWLATFVVARRWRRWPAYLLGTPVFLVALFMFFENFAGFVPANI